MDPLLPKTKTCAAFYRPIRDNCAGLSSADDTCFGGAAVSQPPEHDQPTASCGWETAPPLTQHSSTVGTLSSPQGGCLRLQSDAATPRRPLSRRRLSPRH